jgi:hypothetical protein
MTGMTSTTRPQSDGPLTRRVLAYVETMERLVPTVRAASDWSPLAAHVDTERFERVGVYMEVQSWEQYVTMLTGWAASIERFESRVRRISELAPLVYYETEEHHFHGEQETVVNSMTVFELGDDGRIRHLEVYLQQPR